MGPSTRRSTATAASAKLFVDCAGDTVPVFDGATGEERRAHVFVAVIGVELHLRRGPLKRGTGRLERRSRQRADVPRRRPEAPGLRQSQVRCHGGVPLRTRDQPHLPGHGGPLRHGGAADADPPPARQGQGRNRGPDCRAFILAKLRNRRFLSLGELNEAVGEVLGDLNARLMRRLGASRREFFDTIDRPALQPLPPEPYAYAEWRRCRVRARLSHRAARAFLLRTVTADPRGRRSARHRLRIPGSCRLAFREMLAHHSGLMSPAIPI